MAPFLYRALITFILAYIFLNIVIFDDPYITFRVVDNFVHGYGLRWNIDERVQVYTHPLWMLIHIPFYAIFQNIYWVTIGISAIFGILAVRLLLKLQPQASYAQKSTLVLLPLGLSSTFREYVVCGLENPLTFFLFAWFLYHLLRPRNTISIYRLTFIASLLLITRFDTLFVMLPLLTAFTWQYWREVRIRNLLYAAAPALTWYLFSLWYYGSFFPNTKYAKMGMHVPLESTTKQGLLYLYNFCYFDPVAALWIAAFLTIAARSLLIAIKNGLPTEKTDTIIGLVGVGFLLHTIYIVCIGGDFMPGRFLSNQLILAIGCLFFLKTSTFNTIKTKLWITLILLGISTQMNLINHVKNFGINDQSITFRSMNGIRSQNDSFLRIEPTGHWVDIGKHTVTDGLPPIRIVVISGVPFYYSGSKIIGIDRVGIADALLGRLPTSNPHSWQIGHPRRNVPNGYLHARQTGDLSQMAPDIAEYYAKIRIITSGDLWSITRLLTIIEFNAGMYDHWLKAYLVRTSPNRF